MALPYLNNFIAKNEVPMQAFGGLNQTVTPAPNEFADMKNMSSRHFPAAATRQARGALVDRSIATPYGLFFKNGCMYVASGSPNAIGYYKADGSSTFTGAINLQNNVKQIVGLGAYIIFFPDQKMFNTSDSSIVNLPSTFGQPVGVSATFAPLTEGSVYTKITVTGIGEKFNQYDAVTISGCTVDPQFNATKVITEKGTNYIVVTGKIDETLTQASGLSFRRKVPSMDFVCERDARLFGCSSENHEVYACKPGDPTNWYNYEGISTDAWAATVGSDGEFTGVCAYSNYVLFWKENCVHILRGDKPSNFSLMERALPGVRKGCDRSLEVVNDTLYYVGRNGVYAFDGASPVKVSDSITGEITQAVASQQDGKYYLSCLLDSVQTLLVYDTKNKLWHKEDGTRFKFAQYADGELHYIDGDNKLTTITGDRSETIDWFLESGDITEGSLSQKYIGRLKFRLWMALDSVAIIYARYDDGAEWERVITIRSTKDQTYPVHIIPRRCHKYRWRIEGHGQMKLMGMSREVEGGSEYAHGHFSFGYRR